MKTRQELESLKSNWRGDPCWDIETTEGFEEHYDELLAYRKQREAEWEAKRNTELIERSRKLGCSVETAQYIDRLERRLSKLESIIANMNV